MSAEPRGSWVVLGRTEMSRWGGDLRRRHIFQSIVDRTGAATSERTDRSRLWSAIRGTRGALVPWRRVRLASADLLTPNALPLARVATRPAALDVHDHPVLQLIAFGQSPPSAWSGPMNRRIERNLTLFPMHVVPSASFAALAGLDPGRIIVAPNGSDTAHVVPGPFPSRPTIGLVSGAAPNRGIEALIDAAARLRPVFVDLQLRLWLASSGENGQAYVESLRQRTADAQWIEIGNAPYDRLGEILATATVLVV
ncbi:MAG TPA: hypothetical protein VKR30_03180, partial [Candidatus Limnocylindrales bacterium]|nr:hypothetical protein [Candidatus Limnocylindrales bacterium]